jgi:hypothetical protein
VLSKKNTNPSIGPVLKISALLSSGYRPPALIEPLEKINHFVDLLGVLIHISLIQLTQHKIIQRSKVLGDLSTLFNIQNSV